VLVLVRKTVTVLFCDVTESTQLGERIDPESLRHVMSRYFDEMRAVLERHGGTVEKFAGDEVMAVFGVPQVHEDDALRAVRAAAEMRDRLEELNGELEAGYGVRLQTRIGVNTGEVVAGDPASGQTFVTGDPVVVGRRLQQAAAPGEILIGKATYPLVKDAVRAGPLESFPAKGKLEGVARRRVDDVDARAPGFARRLDTPMVGRRKELAALTEAFDQAVAEPGCRLFTVLGPAGIGKSRLAGELLGELDGRATALTGRCLPYGEGITFWPLVQILREAGGESALEETLAGVEDAEAIAERVRGAVGAAPLQGASEEIFWAVRRFLETLARERPLVVCFEDIHWAEPTLLDLIEYLAGWTRGVPILLLCLARPDLLERQPTWVAPRPNAAVLSLDPLSEAESESLLASLGGELELSSEARERIAAAAEGNPLFAEQMLAMVGEQGGLEGFSIPPSIQALLAERLDRLDAGERAVIERAAVVGREFPRGAVADLSPPELRPEVGRHLMALVRRELIQPDMSTFARDDGFSFRHALIRDAAYEGMPKEVRADLHERLSGWIEAHAEDRATELEEIVGYHLEQAYRLREQLGPVDDRGRELAARAGGLLGLAGQRAFARDDMPAALNLLDRAVSLVTSEDPVRLELVRELSNSLWAVGELARAEALLNGLIEAAAAGGDRRQEWYGLLDRSARGSFSDYEAADDLLVLAEQAIGVFEELGDDVGLARAWRRIALAHHMRRRYAAGEEASERGLVHARRAGVAQEESRLVDRLCTSLLYGPTPSRAAIARCESMLEQIGGNRLMEANIISSLGGLQAMQGRFDEARALHVRAEATYEDLGLRLPIGGLTQIAGPVELLAGDAVAAERLLRRGFEILAGVGSNAFQAALLAEALYAQGRHAEADEFAGRAEAEAAAEEIGSQVLWRGVRAKLEARRGNAGHAVRAGREGVRLAAGTDAVNMHADALVALAEALSLADRPNEATRARKDALRLYDLKENVVAAARIRELLAQPVR
jgi:class 3 adenylate cyclase/tetratricopeptide (TPR) repeat protein